MAIKKMYSVYDIKVAFFHDPMFMRNAGEALRSWEDQANNEKSMVCAHPSDFDLFEIGEFDDQTAKVSLHQSPVSLGLALKYKRPPSDAATLFSENVSQMKG